MRLYIYIESSLCLNTNQCTCKEIHSYLCVYVHGHAYIMGQKLPYKRCCCQQNVIFSKDSK